MRKNEEILYYHCKRGHGYFRKTDKKKQVPFIEVVRQEESET